MIFRPSGGVLYHWRAFRRRAHWAPFVRELETWLAGWSNGKPPAAQSAENFSEAFSELILIGPSGGYTLPPAWLKCFSKIYAYDLDPLAPMFFRRVHRGVKVQFFRQDAFWRDGRLSAEPIKKILALHPNATVLFSNVLGQLLLEGKAEEPEWFRFLETLRAELAGRKWASYHDLYTHEDGEIIDHLLAGDWRQGLPTAEFRWPLSVKSLHVIEGVHSV